MKALLLKDKNQWKEMKIEDIETPTAGKGKLS